MNKHALRFPHDFPIFSYFDIIIKDIVKTALKRIPVLFIQGCDPRHAAGSAERCELGIRFRSVQLQ